MTGDKLQIFIAMCAYMAFVIGIGLYYAKRANESSENYFLGGRTLGPWVTAMSAEASDMSGWLLMGLPGVAYWCGLSDAIWTAIGLGIGTYVNWLFVAKRLRRYSAVAGDAITVPDFFSNRFKENKKVIMTIAALFILIFFTVYAASCFVTVGKLFSTLFGVKYQYMMVAGALFVVLYTILGGFLAESVSDFMQAIVMVFVLVFVFIVGTSVAGGISAVLKNAKDIPGFFEFFGIAQPTVVDGVQQVSEAGKPLFGEAGHYGFLTILSTLSWGLGYFGMPQVLLRFMAIRKSEEITMSRRIATVWCFVSLFAAVSIGMIGRALYPSELLTQSSAESIFILMATKLLPALFAGIAMAGILAATISSSDSYLLIAASAFAKNIYQGVIKKNANDQEVMVVSRVVLILISILGMIIALDETSVIFTVVSFAWAGFGATFGPIMLFSLFWKRTTRSGAIAGMISGGVMVFVWKLMLKPLGGIFGIYELLPAFIISCIVIVIVSLISEEPSQEIQKEFELAKTYEC
ncbi:sodium/proline symporter PutP [Defluviitalea raffinosedens]|uniref:sodium/proline symporter PutP n=1 Tax=Defluviitalea raffinosedens TaxID=1450156 RepID=UPI001958272F|nr:sodium/proline symporter PutP [Defluviitalea raffinosedens]MBM7686559.1 sodium/proline symporter [Defluviitalea raffinosedens]